MWLLEQFAVVQTQFLTDGVEGFYRIAARGPGNDDEVDQHLRAFNVPQELMSEPVSFVGAFDQSRDVRNDEAAFAAQRDDAKVRRQCREWVISNLRLCCRDPRDERGLAGIRESDETDI